MKLIVGLGNPGPQYEKTRHNMGWRAAGALVDRLGGLFDHEKFKSDYCLFKGDRFPDPIMVMRPLTFMNLSGEAVQAASSYFKIPAEDILVIFDDMDTEVGDIRLREKGSSGGHKGMQSIIDLLGTQQIKRIKIGIGKAEKAAVVDYVLGKPSKEEAPLIDEAIERAVDAAVYSLSHPFEETMSRFNSPKAK